MWRSSEEWVDEFANIVTVANPQDCGDLAQQQFKLSQLFNAVIKHHEAKFYRFLKLSEALEVLVQEGHDTISPVSPALWEPAEMNADV